MHINTEGIRRTDPRKRQNKKISNFLDKMKQVELSQKGVIHTCYRLNMVEVMCQRQRERQGVTRIQLLTWLNSLGNTSCPHNIKHAKLSAVSLPPSPSCPLIDSRSAGVPRSRNGERAHAARWRERRGGLRGKGSQKGDEGRRECREGWGSKRGWGGVGPNGFLGVGERRG